MCLGWQSRAGSCLCACLLTLWWLKCLSPCVDAALDVSRLKDGDADEDRMRISFSPIKQSSADWTKIQAHSVALTIHPTFPE